MELKKDNELNLLQNIELTKKENLERERREKMKRVFLYVFLALLLLIVLGCIVLLALQVFYTQLPESINKWLVSIILIAGAGAILIIAKVLFDIDIPNLSNAIVSISRNMFGSTK